MSYSEDTAYLRLTLPFIPLSLKNTPHRWSKQNAALKRELQGQRDAIHALGAAEMVRRRLPSFGDRDIDFHLAEFPSAQTVILTVADAGPRPKQKRGRVTGRRRDLQNLEALPADALQNVCYDDDNQIVRTASVRLIDADPDAVVIERCECCGSWRVDR